MVQLKDFGLHHQGCNMMLKQSKDLGKSYFHVLVSHTSNGVVLHSPHSPQNDNTYIEEGSVDVIGTVILTLSHQKWSRSIGCECNVKNVIKTDSPDISKVCTI